MYTLKSQVWVPMTGSCFMLGLALGSLVFGVLSDKIGRRHTLLIAILTARFKKTHFSFCNVFFGDQHPLCGGLPDAWLCLLRSPEGPHWRRLRRMVSVRQILNPGEFRQLTLMYLFQLHCCLCHGDGDCGDQRRSEKTCLKKPTI